MNLNGPANGLLRSVGKPAFIYGTAWKKEDTARLVHEALTAGFTAIDTAAQPRHYREDLVGAGIRAALSASALSREQLFLQTKFTAPGGQDLNNMPYESSAPLPTQIATSLASSFRNLRALDASDSAEDTYIDSLVLHSPMETDALTLEAWKTLETYVPGRIRALGISNTPLSTLKAVYEGASVKPSVVQNRFYARTGYDVELRAFCREKGIVYQSFWTLTGNRQMLESSAPIAELAKLAGVSKEVALYALVLELGIAVLNGTTNKERMAGDLKDIARVRNWTFVYGSKWDEIVSQFKQDIGENEEG